jgi:hypothetical protein
VESVDPRIEQGRPLRAALENELHVIEHEVAIDGA